MPDVPTGVTHCDFGRFLLSINYDELTTRSHSTHRIYYAKGAQVGREASITRRVVWGFLRTVAVRKPTPFDVGVLLRGWVEESVASAGGGGGDQLTVDSKITIYMVWSQGKLISLSAATKKTWHSLRPVLCFSSQGESWCECTKQASNNFMEIQNVAFAKKHGSLANTGFIEISSRENQ